MFGVGVGIGIGGGGGGDVDRDGVFADKDLPDRQQREHDAGADVLFAEPGLEVEGLLIHPGTLKGEACKDEESDLTKLSGDGSGEIGLEGHVLHFGCDGELLVLIEEEGQRVVEVVPHQGTVGVCMEELKCHRCPLEFV